ncbi:MAG TPA: PKD domain-containing protein, partial [Bacteroidales bacterium]|nr:PKD domain-containing protein [Bacteroidales bacterium]
ATNRWGDYAEMSIDPVDDVTFWFTTEYYNSGKKTKIANWQFGVATLPPNTNFVINTPNTLLRPVPLLEGQSATFTNLTTGQVDNWLWTFPGGTPGSSTAQDPGSITYNTAGLYDVSLYADNSYGDSTLTRTDYIKVIDPNVVTCDTLIQFYGTPVVYRSSGGGYVGGTNEYGCQAIAEKFDNFSPYNKITGGRFYWAQATNGTNPDVTFVLWGDDGSGSPGTQLATKVVPLSDIVNDMAVQGYTDIAFSAEVPLPATGAFFLGFEMPGDAASGDTLAIATNTDSDGPDDTGYSLYSGWETYSAWSMSLMNAIFAYGCYDPYMPPVADFEGIPTLVNAGNSVNFTDLSYGGTPTSWSWSFSGGTPTTSTTQNPTITYNTPGYYDVTLTVTNSYGSDTKTKTNYIHVVDPNSCSCGELGNVVGSQVLYTTGNGYVSGNNQYGDEAKAEYFDSYAPYTEINGAYLYFGYAYVANASTNITINIWDNSGTGGSPGTVIASTTVPITTIANDVANGDSTYVSFPAVSIPGPFYIGFIIPNPTSAGDTVALMSGLINSSSPNTAWERWNGGTWYAYSDASSWGGDWNLSIFPVVCTTGSPLVDFTVNNTLIAAGNTLDFTDLSTCGPTSWSWDFGGGGIPNTSTNQNPTITFNTPGTYDVILTASNASGSNSELKTSYITVLEPIVWWDFPNNPDDNTADGGITANLTKTIDVFGGATLQGFASAGASTNAAQARNFSGGSGLKGWIVDFTTTGYENLILYSKQNGDVRSPKDWKVQYSIDGSTWVDVPNATITCANDWTTGVLNGVALPTACEDQATVYLRWIMTSNDGIGGSIFNTRDNLIDDIMVAGIAIGTPPVADFSADATSVCEGGTITFTDLSTNSPTSWDWDFGDGSAHSTQQNPSHVYATAGTYTVILTATNSAGSDTETKTNYIIVNPNPTVTTSVTDVSCNGGNDGSATAIAGGGTPTYT